MASLVIQIVSICGAFGLGLSRYRGELTGWSVLLGLFADIIGQVFLAGEGPGAFVGLVILPVYCILASHLGRGLRWLVFRKSRQRH